MGVGRQSCADTSAAIFQLLVKAVAQAELTVRLDHQLSAVAAHALDVTGALLLSASLDHGTVDTESGGRSTGGRQVLASAKYGAQFQKPRGRHGQ